MEKFPHENLSDREFQVMHLIARGLGIKDIASKLNLGISTISTYRSRIFEKTGFKNNAELINYAVKNRLVD